MNDDSAAPWTNEDWRDAIAQATSLIATSKSPFELGEVLALDRRLDMPYDVIAATYDRLIALGADDVRTKLCYVRYRQLHDPSFDDEAAQILQVIEPIARAAGVWMNSTLGHHPVFYSAMMKP